MRLKKFQIKNYKNLENIEFTWKDIIILIGENNTGKSSVLEALYWFLSGNQISDILLFRSKLSDDDHVIELIGTFDKLTELDKRQKAIQGRIFQEQWILKKKYWINEKNKGESKYYSYEEAEIYKGWPEENKEAVWDDWPENYQDLIEKRKGELGSKPTKSKKDKLRELVKSEKPDLIEKRFDWKPDPGGGGGWKSNANSIIPKYILVPAVYDATVEGKSKERQSMTTYGEILSLLIEKKLANREEVKQLKTTINRVKALFQPDPENPEWKQAKEIIDFQNDLSALLSKVIKSEAFLEPGNVSIPDIILPNTTLWIDDGFKTKIAGQGHGLQRTLIMSLLQMLVDYETMSAAEGDTGETSEETFNKSVVFAIEEPELYMHPQMERKMRDTLYNLSESDDYQVICCTHSPVFIDMAEKHTAIVRLEIDEKREITPIQVTDEIFTGNKAPDDKKRLRMITEFDPAVNELFFAKRVVLVEGDTEIAVFQKGAELMKLFDRNPHVKRDTTFINCHGKWTIILFLEVLNHFGIKYVVFHDEDQGKEQPMQANDAIGALVHSPNERHMFSPKNLESVLGYDTSTKDKPIKALKKIEELAGLNSIPIEFQEHVKVAWGV